MYGASYLEMTGGTCKCIGSQNEGLGTVEFSAVGLAENNELIE
jgi:hypothetical protein